MEPRLNTVNIQGRILPGMFFQHHVLRFFRIVDAAAFKRSLRQLAPYVSSAADVLSLRERTEEERATAIIVNIAFTWHGLRMLNGEADSFADEAFREGMAARAGYLGDPADETMPGHPARWKVRDGGGDAPAVAHVLLSAHGMWRAGVVKRSRELTNLVGGALPAGFAGTVFPGEDRGAAVSVRWGSGNRSKEHFGYADGVSQPGLRGMIGDGPNDFLTRRGQTDEVARPGRTLVWPGEFMFGYSGQSGLDVSEPGPVRRAGPSWADDGSFLVFRRIHQEVGIFHRFLNELARRVRESHGYAAATPAFIGSQMVGRWTSGCPVILSNNTDDVALGGDESRSNDFDYGADPAGEACPFSSHVRKSNPRNDKKEGGDGPYIRLGGDVVRGTDGSPVVLGPVDTERRRILRRGFPYGPASISTPDRPFNDGVDRGLHFVAYMTSIGEQFEFIARNWLNNPDFKETEGGPLFGGGVDPILGRTNAGQSGTDWFYVACPDSGGAVQRIRVNIADVSGNPIRWTWATGGGYFFAPSLAALGALTE